MLWKVTDDWMDREIKAKGISMEQRDGISRSTRGLVRMYSLHVQLQNVATGVIIMQRRKQRRGVPYSLEMKSKRSQNLLFGLYPQGGFLHRACPYFFKYAQC